jgi:hypothetical protein
MAWTSQRCKHHALDAMAVDTTVGFINMTLSAVGRLHSVMNGRFRGVRLRGRLYGDELGKGSVIFRP